ncbi:MAG: hypothetical protein AAFR84_18755 [Pseudomonadota bacterium]
MKNLHQIVANFGSLGVGFKLAIIVSGYIGAGSFAKWVIDIWYPFTRRLWGDLAKFLSLPELYNYEKDALTALVFFVPFGVAAALAPSLQHQREQITFYRREQLLAFGLGTLFFYLVCRDLISGLLRAFSGD